VKSVSSDHDTAVIVEGCGGFVGVCCNVSGLAVSAEP